MHEATQIQAQQQIANKTAKIIVTTIESLMQPMINSKVLYSNCLTLKNGQEFSLEKLKEALLKLRNFENADLVQKNILFMDYLQNGVPVRYFVKNEEYFTFIFYCK